MVKIIKIIKYSRIKRIIGKIICDMRLNRKNICSKKTKKMKRYRDYHLKNN